MCVERPSEDGLWGPSIRPPFKFSLTDVALASNDCFGQVSTSCNECPFSLVLQMRW